ncbi:hypothetical protein ACWDUD_08645 [Rhodococcus sp. NPDC003382]|uniref:hypothetical protein n=1 Tax=unclassified Rhodococcus (in: high G+C Gram-positive bacteria) TaxID=192944 RepID=UPI0018CD8022|nr:MULTISPECIES: hypothetical protein [unclassified Rhodococcus (in: high G+C Gram-positive bacteria)]MBH0120412.1 hypothetical protein [Rhodococcus sp. CX]MCK8673847.1 hypothetical protein [Rhodococcus sp. HM1]
MKKIIAAALVASGAVLSLAACSDDDSDSASVTTDNSVEMQTPTEEETTADETTVTSTDELGAFDQAKLSAFVVAFRTGYSDLSENRDDASIENIVITSCNDLASGADEQQVTQQIMTLAANNDVQPTAEQAEQIYDLVTPACP